MGYFRFRRTLKILPGVRLNFNKRSASVSVGVRGAHYTVGPNGKRMTVGIPGTGLSYTDYQAAPRPRRSGAWVLWVLGIIILLAILGH